MYFKPLPAVALYNGVSNAYAVPRRSPYINSTNNAVPHYFVKGVIRNFLAAGVATAAQSFTFDTNVCIHAKDLQ